MASEGHVGGTVSGWKGRLRGCTRGGPAHSSGRRAPVALEGALARVDVHVGHQVGVFTHVRAYVVLQAAHVRSARLAAQHPNIQQGGKLPHGAALGGGSWGADA